jgi:ABC-type uncharacterized transport system permease subunit
MGSVLNGAFLFAVVLQTTPLLLAALGGLFGQQANVLNISLDGKMLMGAFVGIAVGAATHSVVIAILAAIGSGIILGLLFAWVVLWLRADPVVVGIGIGILVSGLTTLLLSVLYHNEGSYVPSRFPRLLKLDLGPLRHIPILGPAFQQQTVLVLLAIALIPFSTWLLFHTRYGLRVRAVGEEQSAASAAGLNPRAIKLSTIVISGALCGLAGAQLSMATLDQFIANMTAGRGFIVIAAIFVGRARPYATAAACLVFGAVSALATQLQLRHLPADLMLMLPYVVTVLLLVARPLVRRATAQLRGGMPGPV